MKRVKENFKEARLIIECKLTAIVTSDPDDFYTQEAKDYIKEGRFNLDGDLAVNPDGGLLSFGHPVGATGLRTIYEVYKQLQGKSDERQRKNPSLGLAHSFGLMPGSGIALVTILGQRD